MYAARMATQSDVTLHLHIQAYGGPTVIVWSQQDDLIGSDNHVRCKLILALAVTLSEARAVQSRSNVSVAPLFPRCQLAHGLTVGL
jgi:hypothetical protein